MQPPFLDPIFVKDRPASTEHPQDPQSYFFANTAPPPGPMISGICFKSPKGA